ncbi:3571_t:CDS:2, partial [Ambispora gerdemannii]
MNTTFCSSNEQQELAEIALALRMPEPHLKEDYKNNPNLRVGYLYTNYKREEIKIPDESSQNKPLTKSARIKKNIKNIELSSDYLSRLDYGDIRVSAKFQEVFKNEFNKYFEIEVNDYPRRIEDKLRKKELNLDDNISDEIIVDARFEDYDIMALEFAKRGRDIPFERSGSESKFRPAITQVLREYKPISDKLLKEKKKLEEQKGSYTFTIKDEYRYTEDYEE